MYPRPSETEIYWLQDYDRIVPSRGMCFYYGGGYERVFPCRSFDYSTNDRVLPVE